MTQHIGIVACSAEGAALCYRTICIEAVEIMGEHMHPQISMHTYPLGEYMTYIYKNDWESVAKLMLSSAEKVAAIGADFVICPDNTIHQCFKTIAEKSPIPWIHIAENIGKEAHKRGSHTLGIMGTKFLMNSSVYPDALRKYDIGYAFPDTMDQEKINTVIFNELVYGLFYEQSKFLFNEIIEKFKYNGCDAVVLGCTEIPLLVDPADSPLPVLDSTRLLAKAALLKAVGIE